LNRALARNNNLKIFMPLSRLTWRHFLHLKELKMTDTFIVVDAEFGFDLDAHAAFQKTEGFDASGPVEKVRPEWVEPRWVFRTPAAISWMMITADREGGWHPVDFKSVSLYDDGANGMLSKLSKALQRVPHSVMVTWGGEACDLPRLRLAFLNAGLPLPPVLQAPYTFDVRQPNHWDLWSKLCGRAGNIHLNEMAAAMGLPTKVTGRPSTVAQNILRGRWSLVKSCAECDVLTTALILIRYLNCVSGSGSGSGSVSGGWEARDNLMRVADIGRAQKHRPYAEAFEDYHATLSAQPHPADTMIAEELRLWSA
jgi:Predicted 3'-5' exonuclease related to the exonuclease domain of PolB